MARDIDPEDIASGNLTRDEIIYLQDRNELPDHIDRIDTLLYAGGGQPDFTAPIEAEAKVAAEPVADYDEGWTNSQRRAELTTRGLSVAGRKDDLVARLVRSDRGETLPEDAPSDSDDSTEGDDD